MCTFYILSLFLPKQIQLVMRTINWSFLVAVFFLLQGCFLEENKDNASQHDAAQEDGHPAWIMQGNIYEVNTRQITPEGTFKAFSAHLDRLKEMGVQTLWFMPIHPISMKDRKRDTTELGSYYAVADYTAINHEFVKDEGN